jgi:hypothetical protein
MAYMQIFALSAHIDEVLELILLCSNKALQI